MTVVVDIEDRQYDYTDEEKAAQVVADFQAETGLGDEFVIDLWNSDSTPQRSLLEQRIIAAVDLNGSAKRAQETVPAGITLYLETEEA
ncbi:hypothetical protein MMA231_01255 [Asticcacaulis sp. MM231]|uniref:hypothetical protein n=1 Tax=Asticcacaulis sp. MM231 TaxID=3157666 RepID=UPI0032D5A0DB